MITFICTECGAKLRVKDEAGGKRIRCPQCQKPTFVPQDEPQVEIPVDPPVRIPVDPPVATIERDRTKPAPAASVPVEYRRRRTRVAEEGMPRSAKIAFILSLVGLAVPVIPSIVAIILAIIGIGVITREKMGGMGLAVTALVLGLFFPIGHWLFVWPAVDHYITSVDRATCFKRLTELHSASTLPDGVHDWPETLEKLVAKKRLSPQLLTCAADGKHRRCAYFYIKPEVLFPPSRVVLCDYGDNHTGVRVVMFVDGRIEWLEPEAFNRILKEPANAHFRSALLAAETKMGIQE
jgi:DNA-directed RNA polymerase subunit RPC12/RpoP